MEVQLPQNGKCEGEATVDLDFVSQLFFFLLFRFGSKFGPVLLYYNLYSGMVTDSETQTLVGCEFSYGSPISDMGPGTGALWI